MITDFNVATALPTYRPGIMGKKLGMTSMFLGDAKMIPVTLVQLMDGKVLQEKSYSSKRSLLLGFGSKKEKHLTKPMKSFFDKLGFGYYAAIKEFVISGEFAANIGDDIRADFFAVGKYVDVSAKSVGKGFAGAMKRWNFAGLEASHGVSISHRSHGSVGQRKDPGKVFKGKKMAGHMGHKKVTMHNLEIMQIIPEQNVLVIKGCVPGPVGAEVIVKDAIKKLS